MNAAVNQHHRVVFEAVTRALLTLGATREQVERSTYSTPVEKTPAEGEMARFTVALEPHQGSCEVRATVNIVSVDRGEYTTRTAIEEHRLPGRAMNKATVMHEVAFSLPSL